VPHDLRLPARFLCEFAGPNGVAVTGPVRAYRQEFRASGGELLGIAARINCSWPTLERLRYIAGGTSPNVTLDVSVDYTDADTPSTSARLRSSPAAYSTVQIADLPEVSPPAPPPPPPADPPEVTEFSAVAPSSCGGSTNLAGLGGSNSDTYEEVAAFWCKTLGGSSAVSWTPITSGSPAVCYVNSNSLTLGAPLAFSTFGCTSSYQCMQNLVCQG